MISSVAYPCRTGASAIRHVSGLLQSPRGAHAGPFRNLRLPAPAGDGSSPWQGLPMGRHAGSPRCRVGTPGPGMGEAATVVHGQAAIRQRPSRCLAGRRRGSPGKARFRSAGRPATRTQRKCAIEGANQHPEQHQQRESTVRAWGLRIQRVAPAAETVASVASGRPHRPAGSTLFPLGGECATTKPRTRTVLPR